MKQQSSRPEQPQPKGDDCTGGRKNQMERGRQEGGGGDVTIIGKSYQATPPLKF